MGSAERTASILKYAQLGLKIQPIHWITRGLCSCGNKDCKSAGKHPLTSSGYMDASSDEIVILGWLSRWPKCNIGLTMGQVYGHDVNGQAQRLVALDIDPRNGGTEGLDRLLSKHGQLPDTATQLTQSGGFHYLLLAPANATFPGLLDDGVEVKTKNHINVYPSVGPKGSYEWEASADLLEGFNIAQCPEWMLEVKKQAPILSVVGSSVYVDPKTVNDLKEALPYILADDYNEWIKVGQALKGLGQQGFALWNNWSELSKKYSAKAMRPKWESFNPSEINYQSIFTMAEQNGWVNNARSEQEAFIAKVARANRAPKIITKPAKSRPDLKFNSDLDTLAILLQAGSDVRNADSGRAAALSFLSYCAGRRYLTEHDEPVHLYTAIIAPSLSEIRHFKNSLSGASVAVGLGKSLRCSRLSALSSVYSTLYKSPNLLYIADDYGSQLAFAKRQPAGCLEQALHGISGCFDNEAITIDNPMEYQIKDAPRDGCTIYMPCVSLLALLSEDQASLMLSTNEIGRGSLGQFLFVYADPELTQLSEPTPVVWPDWLKAHVLRIRNSGPILDTTALIDDHPEQVPDVRRVVFSAKPDAYYDQLMSISDNRLVRSLLISSRSLLKRVAALLAIWRCPETPIVIADDLDYAFRYVSTSVELTIDRLRLLSSEDGKLSISQKVMAVIDRAGVEGITEGRLRDYCRAYKSLSKEDRGLMLEAMTSDGDVLYKQTSNNRGLLIISTKFVDEVFDKNLNTDNTDVHRHDLGDCLLTESGFITGVVASTQTTQTLLTPTVGTPTYINKKSI